MDGHKREPVYTEHGYIYEDDSLQEETRAEEPGPEETVSYMNADTEKEPEERGPRSRGPLLLGILLALLLGAGAGVWAFLHTQPADALQLNAYVRLMSIGYDGYGRVEMELDEAKLESDIADFLLARGSIEAAEGQTGLEAFQASAHYQDIMDAVHYSLDRTEGLSNGDEVTLTAAYEPGDPEGYGLVCEAEPVVYQISGLAEVEERDPFEELILSVSGTAPEGVLHMEYESDLPWTYRASMDSGLSNGDKIQIETVLKEDMDEKDLAAAYGLILTRTGMTYQVEGIPAYAMAVDEIGEETLLALQEEAMETARAEVENGYAQDETLREIQPASVYLLSGREEGGETSNTIFFLFRISYGNRETEFDYYYFVSYKDLVLYPDGSWNLDQDSYEIPQSLHGLFGLIDSGDYVRIDRMHAVTGFASTEDFYAAYIEPEEENWKVSVR